VYRWFTQKVIFDAVVPKKIILAGLMNPGDQYRHTRHNAGAIALDTLFSDAQYAPQKNLDAWVAETDVADQHFILIKPQTFMNLSGQSVVKALKKYNSESTQLIVLHDEVELKVGEVRHKFGGGHKGHNGLRSIMGLLGNGDFHRIRIGVGRPHDERFGIADYLLSAWPALERPPAKALHDALDVALKAINNA